MRACLRTTIIALNTILFAGSCLGKIKKQSTARRFFKGFLPGAAGGGLIAGLAGGGKWTPVGILAGGALGSAVSLSRKKSHEREK